jgi:hypothetical protein
VYGSTNRRPSDLARSTAWVDELSAAWSSIDVDEWLVSIALWAAACVLVSGVEMTDPVWDVAPALAAVEPVLSMTCPLPAVELWSLMTPWPAVLWPLSVAPSLARMSP